jgi:hypothetical protein
VIDDLLVRYVEALVYQAVAENMASEQSARMVAMKAATDNAGNVIGELKLVYNKTRQAGDHERTFGNRVRRGGCRRRVIKARHSCKSGPFRHQDASARTCRKFIEIHPEGNAMAEGKIVQCIGAVVDVEFPRDQMPRVYDA